MGLREGKKSPNFYASPQYIFSGLQCYFLPKKNPISHFFSQPGFVCKLKWKGTKNSSNTCPLSNQVQWLQKPRDGTWFVPCFSQWKQKLVLGIRRMSYYSFIIFVFLTTNIFHFMSSKSEFNCCNYWSFRKKKIQGH